MPCQLLVTTAKRDSWAALQLEARPTSRQPVASLGLVSPGAATDGVTPIFLLLS